MSDVAVPRPDFDGGDARTGWDSAQHGRSSDRPSFVGSQLAGNLLELFDKAVARNGEAPFLWHKRDKQYRSSSWREIADASNALASYLVRHGLRPGERVILAAENRPEWCVADLAIMRAGGVTVPAYATNLPDDHRYVVDHSEAVMVVVGNRAVMERMASAIEGNAAIRHVITMDPFESSHFSCAAGQWSSALESSAREDKIDFVDRLSPDDLACFIYTSGTGGRPKSVMLSHRNIMANMWGAYDLVKKVGLDDETFLSFLPLSHSYEHTVGQFLPMAIDAQIYYSEGAEHLAKNFVEVKPTIVACVPRLYEVLRQKMMAAVEREGGVQAKLFAETLRLGIKRYENGGRLPVMESARDFVLERLVRNKVRGRFGGRLKALVSGGAPLNYEVGLFFTALGLPVLQGYGQTESSPVISVNPPNKVKLETVGPPLDGVEVRIADDGEILVRGDLVMLGYWKDLEATRQAVRDGWLHTGDIGAIDSDGYLRITDRKKDMIVNSGGDNIAPQKVEGHLMLQPEIEQAVVFGDRQPYLVAIIVPPRELIKKVAAETGLPANLEALQDVSALRSQLQEALKRANEHLSVIERVRRFALAAEPFTPENGMMTPTMKLRRQLVSRRYQKEIEALYRS